MRKREHKLMLQRIRSRRFYRKHKQKMLERNKIWAQQNPEASREKCRRYYYKNREEILEKRKANNMKKRLATRRYRAKTNPKASTRLHTGNLAFLYTKIEANSEYADGR